MYNLRTKTIMESTNIVVNDTTIAEPNVSVIAENSKIFEEK